MTDILLLLLFCQDVGLWLEEIKLGSYRQIFKENGVIWRRCPCSLLNRFSGL
uniref:Downward leaf curling protein n=1 Tax=Solanum tuberosum TaxID=4113 RepID=M1B512_SOLTU